jgi:hypothetical protein
MCTLLCAKPMHETAVKHCGVLCWLRKPSSHTPALSLKSLNGHEQCCSTGDVLGALVCSSTAQQVKHHDVVTVFEHKVAHTMINGERIHMLLYSLF